MSQSISASETRIRDGIIGQATTKENVRLSIIYEIDMLEHYLILFSSTMRPDDDDDDAGVWLM